MDLEKEKAAFDPRHPRYRRKLWVRVVLPDQAYWHVYWRRVAVVLVAIAVAAWFAVAGGAWAFLKFNRGYAGASYFDIAFYPWRSQPFRVGLAKHYLAAGKKEIEHQEYVDGYVHLIRGLQWIPDDLEARRTVAIMQVRYGLLHRALDTLTDGLPYGPDLDYLKLLFGALFEAKQDQRVLALAKRMLPAKPDDVLLHQFVALQEATAHFEQGRYDDTEKVVGEWRLVDALEGQILLAKCDWERGYPERAIDRLVGQIERFPQRDELYLNLVRLNREFGRTDEARRYALLRYFNQRTSPGPRIDLMHTYHTSNDAAAEAREIETFFADFRADRQALVLVSWFAVDVLEPAVIERAHTLARAQSFPVDEIDYARIELALALRNFRGALALADEALKEVNEQNEDYATSLDGLRALAWFGLKDNMTGENVLAGFLAHARLRAVDALYLARQLDLLGVPRQAREVLARACVLDPRNQAALAQLVKMDAQLGNRGALLENVPKLLRMTKPSRPVLEEALLALGQPGDEPLRAGISKAIASATRTPAPGP